MAVLIRRILLKQLADAMCDRPMERDATAAAAAVPVVYRLVLPPLPALASVLLTDSPLHLASAAARGRSWLGGGG